jgi:hypothetical protein
MPLEHALINRSRQKAVVKLQRPEAPECHFTAGGLRIYCAKRNTNI